eukprot:TRINITY_DN1583_c0_g1_i1.p1 TRINITY_DN1583_c0_g1~~TRINITY_DN1583_c0_g1_i1.p1  ORF type:complete len:317 (-),score=57.51 TRINITY_DN1583_c0_g1_i1:35-913(-)
MFKSDPCGAFEINKAHMTLETPFPLSPEEISTSSIQDFHNLYHKSTLTHPMLTPWLDYCGNPIFSNIDSVKYKYDTYLPYLQTASTEVANMAKYIAYELNHNLTQYDLNAIILGLAQNGGACNVQKEIGIRVMYASMTDSMLQHMNSESVKTKVLVLLRKHRECLVDKVAVVEGVCMNSHYLVTIRNLLAKEIGVSVIPDPNASAVPEGRDFMGVFLGLYTVREVVKVMKAALNARPRTISYHDVLNLIEESVPPGVDLHFFHDNYVFQEGNFTDLSVLLILCKLDVIQIQK